MKVGDKLYRLVLWEDYGRHQFEVRTHTITKINSRTIEIWGCDWKVSKLDLGYKFFTTKKAMYKYYLRLHKEEVKPILNAIKKLENRLKNIRS